MDTTAADGWADSAAAWIAAQGEAGDYGRRFVLDGPMIARLRGRGFRDALDVGCGEGRFCRIMRGEGIGPVGIDPTEALVRRARQLDPQGDYRIGRGEALGVPEGSFDLVVSYLTLIDIPDLRTAIAGMVAALRPGGTLLIANLNSFSTAGPPDGWARDADGALRFHIDHYLEERATWVGWKGIRIRNWHRPLSTYMTLLLEQGLVLRHFAEPAPVGGDPQRAALHRRVPYFHIMEWQKPGT
ncbi:class I SAM-dependent methyltransferase [Vineibacter terrae]|uniref:class I SAM-dependent methyltransferase n=1 Tax=Vineibacter terrae TaxID=2586908 RepID=UPI002E2FA745|nr:class I SAM-dependent methyltransferase [Vineibacter terrae]HEX2889939.1 class I SAM-dependent methyltransferase [Vineibacter terrae]